MDLLYYNSNEEWPLTDKSKIWTRHGGYSAPCGQRHGGCIFTFCDKKSHGKVGLWIQEGWSGYLCKGERRHSLEEDEVLWDSIIEMKYIYYANKIFFKSITTNQMAWSTDTLGDLRS